MTAGGDHVLADAARHSAVRLTVLAVLHLASVGLTLLLPLALGHALDLLLRRQPAAGWVSACAAVVGGQVLLGAAADMLGATTTARAAARIRRRAVTHVLNAGPPATAAAHGTGDLVSRLVGNAADAAAAPAAAAALPATLAAPIGGIVALGLTDPWLAVAFLAGAPPLALLVQRFARASSDSITRYQDAQGRIAARLVEALGGARTIAAAGTEERENARVLTPLPELSAQGRRMWRVQGRATAQAAVLVPLLQVIVLAVAGLRLAHGAISVGDLLAASRYALLATGIGMVVGELGALVRGRAAATRLATILAVPTLRYGRKALPAPGQGGGTAAPALSSAAEGSPIPGQSGGGTAESGAVLAAPALSSAPGGRPRPGQEPRVPTESGAGPAPAVPHPAGGAAAAGQEPCGALEFRGVSAVRGGDTVFEGLDLVVPAGTCVAVVGRSGAGKSVLAALAGRLIDPDAGEVLLDGRPLAGLSRAELRDAVAYAFERPVLLGDTVGDAIAFGPRPLPYAETVAAARAAGADSFVRLLPDGYATPRERAPLSGGETQRLGLARAFAHAGRLLILDDATSSLDTVTERHVARALLAGHRGRTRLLTTHRAVTAARADLVAWLDAGRLRALAPHHELWPDPEYRALFASAAEPGPDTGPEPERAPAAEKAGRRG